MGNFFSTLRKTRQAVFGQIAGLLGAGDIDDETWEELEALLIQGDVGVKITLELLERLQAEAKAKGIIKRHDLWPLLEAELRALLPEGGGQLNLDWPLAVILIVGVNGSGKTTTIGKLAYRLRREGRSILLAAADTFRAAAIDQLRIWGQRAGVPVIAGKEGGDPAAVVYDAIDIARSKKADLLIVDTAGRLHTQHNLMEELRKIRNIPAKRIAWSPHETLLILDATTGQNGLAQARQFTEAVKVSGIILTKLDGSAKGGMVFSIGKELGLPIHFIGTGEGIEDLTPFDPDAFIRALIHPEDE